MPELPEVETVCRGLTLLIVDRLIHTIIVRRSDLRWPVPTDDLCQNLVGHVIHVWQGGVSICCWNQLRDG